MNVLFKMRSLTKQIMYRAVLTVLKVPKTSENISKTTTFFTPRRVSVIQKNGSVSKWDFILKTNIERKNNLCPE